MQTTNNPLITFVRQSIRNQRQSLDDMEQLLNAWPSGQTTGVSARAARTGGGRGIGQSTSRPRSRTKTRARGARGANLNAAAATPTAVARNRRQATGG